MSIASSNAYVAFRGTVPKRKVIVGRDGKEWTFYETGPKAQPAVVLLHGTSGTADSFFFQLSALESRGYHVVSASWGPYWTHHEWSRGFHMFLSELGLRRVHIVAASLGGFLALHYVAAHPTNVASLALCNAFCDTVDFAEQAPCVSAFAFSPAFYLRRLVLESFPGGALPPDVADAVDFMVQQLMTLGREDLGSRLTLNCVRSIVNNLNGFDLSRLTFLDSVGAVALPAPMRQRLYDTFPGATQSLLKEGGDFPYLSAHPEFNMHLVVHLRRQGLFPDREDDARAAAAAAADEAADTPSAGAAPAPEAKERERGGASASAVPFFTDASGDGGSKERIAAAQRAAAERREEEERRREEARAEKERAAAREREEAAARQAELERKREAEEKAQAAANALLKDLTSADDASTGESLFAEKPVTAEVLESAAPSASPFEEDDKAGDEGAEAGGGGGGDDDDDDDDGDDNDGDGAEDDDNDGDADGEAGGSAEPEPAVAATASNSSSTTSTTKSSKRKKRRGKK